MPTTIPDILFSDAVRKVQKTLGSRDMIARLEERNHWEVELSVVHVVIDGIIWGKQAQGFGLEESQCLSTDAIAETYLHLIEQPRSAWTFEPDLRTDKKPF